MNHAQIQAQPARTVRRRSVLKGAAATAGATAVLGATAAERATAASPYFLHGVASGDPLPGAVVLWTRVTPTPLSAPGSGIGPAVDLQWQVATDAAFSRIVRKGVVSTDASRDHTVKLDATGLAPETWYFYRFRYSGSWSPVGRTRTAPAADATPDHLRFGVVSCANLQAGWFSAYRHLADRDDLHAVIHLGDYLYEYGVGGYGYGQSNETIRPHQPVTEMVSLRDYRLRHGQYKQDPDLMRLHAKYPFIATWDDHEVTNDSWATGAENHQAPLEGEYADRKARAHKAYDEWMPVRMGGTAAAGDGTKLFRRLQFGQLAELSMLDLRSYRDQMVPGAVPEAPITLTPSTDVDDPDRTIMGREQLDWLKESLAIERAQWKLVGNPVMIAPITLANLPDDLVDPINDITGLLPRDGAPYNTDQWDGYTDDRREIFEHIRDRGVRDTVFLTGDIHSGWAADLPFDASTYPVMGESAGVEFVCTSITSNNLKDITGTPRRTTSLAAEDVIIANNRHVKYLNFDDHGFSVLDLTPQRAQMDWFVIGDRKDKNAGVTWEKSFVTSSGDNSCHAVEGPVA